jgi:hypothetical protein
LPLITEAYGFKRDEFSCEDEIRFLKVFPPGFEVSGQSEYEERRRIIEKIEHHHRIELTTDHSDLLKLE